MAAKVKVTGALKHRCRRQLEEKLKKGYQAMAKADRATARRNLRAGWETIKSLCPNHAEVKSDHKPFSR